jgi:hypothetical protein
MGGSQAAPRPECWWCGNWVGREVAAYFELRTRVLTGLYGGVLDRDWTEKNYRTRLYPDPPAAFWRPGDGRRGGEAGNAVPAVKSWFYRQSGRSLLVLDSADSIGDADNSSYVGLEYFLTDASLVDVVVTTRNSRAREMSSLEGMEVAEMEASEAAKLFRKIITDNGEEASKIVKELGCLALAIAHFGCPGQGAKMGPPIWGMRGRYV